MFNLDDCIKFYSILKKSPLQVITITLAATSSFLFFSIEKKEEEYLEVVLDYISESKALSAQENGQNIEFMRLTNLSHAIGKNAKCFYEEPSVSGKMFECSGGYYKSIEELKNEKDKINNNLISLKKEGLNRIKKQDELDNKMVLIERKYEKHKTTKSFSYFLYISTLIMAFVLTIRKYNSKREAPSPL